MEGILVFGQDGDYVVLNCVVKGMQIVFVWKDVCDLGCVVGEIVVVLVGGGMMKDVDGVQFWMFLLGIIMIVIFLVFVLIIVDNLFLVVDVGWII